MGHPISPRSTFYSAIIASSLMLPMASSVMAFGDESSKIKPVVSEQIIQKAKKNNNWKEAAITGKDAQVVFMNISQSTNPANEIGMETHKFDQVIFVAEGRGKATLDGQTSNVKAGDLIFIPQGVAHNVVNSGGKKPLKIISVYSDTDIPSGTVYHKKTDDKE